MKLISNHMPKSGGLTFRGHLERIYGKKNVIHDYTLIGRPDYKTTPPPGHVLAQLRRPRKTTIIHGHFSMERYAHIPGLHYVCWVRDPVERLLSHYYYWQRGPDYDHPHCLDLFEQGLSIIEFAKLMPNIFSERFAPLDIDDFAFVGIAGKYTDSLKLFYSMFCPNKKPVADIHENRNFARDTTKYRLDDKLRAELEEINSKDMELYKKALERFEFLRDKYSNGY